MIDEVLEVQGYLRGEHLKPQNLYRICQLLCRWFCQLGYSRLEIREKVFDWAGRNGLHIPYNLNLIIYHASENPRPLTMNPCVRVSRREVQEIARRFDRKNTRLAALAMLCYAKVFSDTNGEFAISSVSLGWLARHCRLQSAGYLPQGAGRLWLPFQGGGGSSRFAWERPAKSKCGRYRIHTPLINTGEYQLDGNDIHGLYETVFRKE